MYPGSQEFNANDTKTIEVHTEKFSSLLVNDANASSLAIFVC